MAEEKTQKHLNMAEEKTQKHYWIIGFVICALIAILARIDLSGNWKKAPVESQEVENMSKETHLNDTLIIRLQIESGCEDLAVKSLQKTSGKTKTPVKSAAKSK